MTDTPVRIAQVIGKMWAGGVENVVFNYYRYMDKTKIQFDFFYDADSTVEPPAELLRMGARFYRIPPYQDMFHYMPVLRRYFRDNAYQIVHSHINTMSVFPLYAAFRERVPVRIAHNHSVPGGTEWRRNLLKNSLRCASRVFPTDYFACSEKAGRWLFGNRTYACGNVHIMKNAVDFSRFASEGRQEALLEKYHLYGKLVVGHVGRFTYAKNHRFLLRIFAGILKRESNAVLLLVGDGELREELIYEIERSGLKEHVILTGKTTEPEKYYPLMNVLILPSVFEGLPVTVIEAQAGSVPVLVSEAVSEEARIREHGWRRMSLEEPVEFWAEAALEMAADNRENKWLPGAEKYDIRKVAPVLGEWYIRRIENLRRSDGRSRKIR